MDIHRGRFVPYPPSTINCLAFSQSTAKASSGHGSNPLRLAVGRANGNIEIWNPARGAWVHETTLYGGQDRSVEGLVWTQDPDEVDEHTGFVTVGRLRLFSIGYSSAVTEWDLSTGLPRRHCSGNYSELWCIAAQPRWKGKKTDGQTEDGEFRGQNLLVGCADGTLVVLSTADDDLVFKRFLARSTQKKSRALTAAFQDRDTVVVGSANGTISVYDVRTGNRIRNIALGAAPKGGPKDILVWTVDCLPDGTIVSGDSTGDVRFYDGKTYTQTQRIAAHEADVLDLAVSQEGNAVFSCGSDRRTVVFKPAEKDRKNNRWARVNHDRLHKHDVKALAAYESKTLSLVASGGVDTNLTIIPLREYGQDHHRAISGLPQKPPMCGASSARLMVSWWNREVYIWRIRKRSNGHKPYKLVAHIHLKGEEDIASTSISDDGRVLSVATSAEVRLFQLSERPDEVDAGLRVQRIDSSALSKRGARLVQLSRNGKWLSVITMAGAIHVYRIFQTNDEDEKVTVLPAMFDLPRLSRPNQQQNAMNGSWGRYDRTITHVAFSFDDDVLAVADIAGYIDSWTLEGFEDTMAPAVDQVESKDDNASDDDSESESEEQNPITIYGQRWIRNPQASLIPKLTSSPLVLSFRPPPSSISSKPLPNGNPAVHPTRHNPHPHSHSLPASRQENRLLVVTSTHQLLEFDILAGGLSAWSARNGSDVLARSVPEDKGKLRDRAMGALWDVSDQWARVWLYGSTWVMMLDLEQDIPDLESSTPRTALVTNGHGEGESSSGQKRKRAPKDDLRNTVSGAGSKVPTSELKNSTLLDRRMEKTTLVLDDQGKKKRRFDSVSLDRPPENAAFSDDEEAHLDGLAAMQRRLNGPSEGDTERGDAVNGIYGSTDHGDSKATGGEPGRNDTGHCRWWISHKFRPILGLVALRPDRHHQPDTNGAGTGVGDDDAVVATQAGEVDLPEVVLVERPFWDLDLPPRFMGVHER